MYIQLKSNAFDEYNNYPNLNVSLLLGLWGKKSQKIIAFMKNHPGEHHYSEVAHKVGMKKQTVKRYLCRFRAKRLVSTPMAPTIIYNKEGLPIKGPLKPKRGYYEYGSSNLVVESVPNLTRFDRSVLNLRIHRVDLWAKVPGAWDELKDSRFMAQCYELAWRDAGNLSCYEGRSKVFNAYLQIFRNSAHYQVLRESVPLGFAGQFGRDFDVSLKLFCGRGAEDIRFKCEVGFDFYAPDLKDVWENSSELKIYNHPVLKRPYARTEVYLKNFNPSVDSEAIYGLMLRNLEPYHRLDKILRETLGHHPLVNPFRDAWEMRPKYRP